MDDEVKQLLQQIELLKIELQFLQQRIRQLEMAEAGRWSST